MKIVHICIGSFYSDGYSYQENLLPKFHKELGYDVSIIAGLDVFDRNGKLIWLSKGKDYIGDYGIPVYRLNLIRKNKISQKLKDYKGLYKRIVKIMPDIIFIHNCQFICITQVIRYLKENNKVRCYVDNHADFSNSATNWISKRIVHGLLWKHCAKSIEPYTTKFYGVLPARVDFLKRIYKLPAEKCELLVMGADDDLVEEARKPGNREQVRNQYGIADNDFLILTGGKIDAYKKQTLLLMKAVKNINNPCVKLLVFGSVAEELLEDVKSLTDDKKVQYIGWIDSNESYRFFAASDLAIFPGRHSVFWEQATAQGIPIVCKYWKGTTHIDLGGNVIFLTQDSVDEIQSVIAECVENKEKYRKMKEIAVNYGMKKFSYKSIAKRSIENI